MRLYKTDKTVISFKNNAVEFLNGLTSNTMDAPKNAFVTIHGKIIAVADQITIDEEEHWMVFERIAVEPLLEHLDKYLKLSGVKAEVIDKNVYFDLEGVLELGENDKAIAQPCGQLVITDDSLRADVSDEEFTLFRLKHKIPVQGIDFNNEFLLNVSVTDLVSFTKGCFLGQEPISKVYNRSKPTWKLDVQKRIDAGKEGILTSETEDPQTRESKGFTFVKNEGGA